MTMEIKTNDINRFFAVKKQSNNSFREQRYYPNGEHYLTCSYKTLEDWALSWLILSSREFHSITKLEYLSYLI